MSLVSPRPRPSSIIPSGILTPPTSPRRNRYKKVTPSVAGKTLFTQTAIAGTADALAVTSDGMATLSATPQYIIITPSAAITGPATIAFDGAAAIPLLSNVGAALAADDLLPRPTLLSVTSTDARIITPW